MKKTISNKAVYHTPNCIFTKVHITQVIAASFGTTDLEEDITDRGGSWTNN